MVNLPVGICPEASASIEPKPHSDPRTVLNTAAMSCNLGGSFMIVTLVTPKSTPKMGVSGDLTTHFKMLYHKQPGYHV